MKVDPVSIYMFVAVSSVGLGAIIWKNEYNKFYEKLKKEKGKSL